MSPDCVRVYSRCLVGCQGTVGTVFSGRIPARSFPSFCHFFRTSSFPCLSADGSCASWVLRGSICRPELRSPPLFRGFGASFQPCSQSDTGHCPGGASDCADFLCAGFGAVCLEHPSFAEDWFSACLWRLCQLCRVEALGIVLLLFLSLCSALLSQLPCWKFSDWKVRRVSSHVWHPEMLRCFGTVYSPAQAIALERHSAPGANSRHRAGHRPFRAAWCFSPIARRFVVLVLGVSHLPTCIWAAPPGLPEAVDQVRDLVDSLPEHVPASAAERLAIFAKLP